MSLKKYITKRQHIRYITFIVVILTQVYSRYIPAWRVVLDIDIILHQSVYMQTSAFSYSLFYLHNQIINYKQTTKSTVCVSYDYATGYNTAVI